LAAHGNSPELTAELNRRLRQLFDEALERPEGERLAFLEQACGENLELLAAVTRLVGLHGDAESFLEGKAHPAKQIGRYVVAGELGRGGMGVVYDAIDPLIGRRVAIKVINLPALADPAEVVILREGLFREARAAGKLFHPGIVTILDMGQEGDMAFVAMERVEGPSLQKILAGPEPVGRAAALSILSQAAAALDYAHAGGATHRDVKPGNILLDRGTIVKITDFGIAKITSSILKTLNGLMVGTPSYMSPEQVEALPADGRSDQFSLAVVAYELLTGHRPFQGDSVATLAHAIVYGKRPSAHAANPALPEAVDEVLCRGLAKLPDGRYANCAEFVAALEKAINQAPPVAPQPRLAGQCRKRIPLRYLAGVASATVTLVLVGLGYRLLSPPRERVVSHVVAPSAVEKPVPPLAEPTRPSSEKRPEPLVDRAERARQLFAEAVEKQNAGLLEEAMTLYRQSAQMGEPRAMEALGEIFLEGKGVAENYAEASAWFRKAADGGNLTAMLYLGYLYQSGVGVAQNYASAIYWFGKAADAGNPAGMFDLGMMYENGQGVAVNLDKARELYRKAVSLGNQEANRRLARLQDSKKQP
jgi:serine/threonine protein kinase